MENMESAPEVTLTHSGSSADSIQVTGGQKVSPGGYWCPSKRSPRDRVVRVPSHHACDWRKGKTAVTREVENISIFPLPDMLIEGRENTVDIPEERLVQAVIAIVKVLFASSNSIPPRM